MGKFNQFITPLPRGHLFGLTLTNSAGDLTNDITFSAGSARNSTDTQNLILTSALTKQLDATWAAGSAAGGRMSAAAITDTTYHCFIIGKPDGTFDVGFDTSPTAPTLPAGYTTFRRLGSIIRTGGAIKVFVQDGDLFMWHTPVKDIDVANPGTSAVDRVLASIPLGVRVNAQLTVVLAATTGLTSGVSVYISDKSVSDMGSSSVNASVMGYISDSATETDIGGQVQCMTDTAATVRSRLQLSDVGTSFIISTRGWVDSRGRLA